jgi:2-C-methyl-D-erythritol 2,4-cyclodiphosphate synthase
MELVSKQGYALANVDSTIILERPKLKDFRSAIRENLARVLALPSECVGVKFKTAEKVGPVGEGRSCEAQAVVLVSRTRQGV